MSAYIQIQNVQKSFAGTARQIEALRDVNLDVQAGEFMCLVGTSGCGSPRWCSLSRVLCRQAGALCMLGACRCMNLIQPGPWFSRAMPFSPG